MVSKDYCLSCDAKKGTKDNKEHTEQNRKQEEKLNAKEIISLLISLTTFTKSRFFYNLENRDSSTLFKI